MSQIDLLEEFAMIAGDIQTLHFSVQDQDGFDIDLEYMTAELKFSLCGQPQYTVLEKTGTKYDVSKVKFTLESQETIYMRGKYMFQLILTDSRDGSVYIPSQGVVNIFPQVGV